MGRWERRYLKVAIAVTLMSGGIVFLLMYLILTVILK